MNTTDETSEFTSPKTNMAPTTTFAKSKKGVVVLAALCLMFFYTGRLSSSSGGGASLDASLLRGFQEDVVRPVQYPFGVFPPGYPFNPCVGNMGGCKPVHDKCKENLACRLLLQFTSTECDCDSDFDCITGALKDYGIDVPIEGNVAIDNFMECIRRNWQNNRKGNYDCINWNKHHCAADWKPLPAQ